jgi:hypothetical protein
MKNRDNLKRIHIIFNIQEMLSLSHHESGGCGRLDLAGPHSTRTGTASVKVIEIVGLNEFHTARANGFRMAGIQSNYMT